MKIIFGRYPKDFLRCRIHEKYMQKKYGIAYPDSNTSFEIFLEKLENIIQTMYNVSINKLLRYRKRKIKVRIDNWDCWTANHTLALIILPLLKKLKEGKNGAPHVDDKDVPEELRSTNARPKKNEYDVDEFYFDRWDYVLDQMIWSFEEFIRDDRESQFYSGDSDILFKKLDNGMSEMVKGPKDTFKCNYKELKKNEAKIQKGLNLFAKYYNNLWN